MVFEATYAGNEWEGVLERITTTTAAVRHKNIISYCSTPRSEILKHAMHVVSLLT